MSDNPTLGKLNAFLEGVVAADALVPDLLTNLSMLDPVPAIAETLETAQVNLNTLRSEMKSVKDGLLELLEALDP